MSNAKHNALASAQERARAVSDAKKAALAKSQAATRAGQGIQVAGTGPLGLPGDVSVFGLKIPTLALIAVGGAVVLALAALAVHAFRKG